MKRKKGNKGREWTEEDVERLLSNPVYCGIGSYQAVVNDDQFIQAAARCIEEGGLERYMRALLANLREAFPEPRIEQTTFALACVVSDTFVCMEKTTDMGERVTWTLKLDERIRDLERATRPNAMRKVRL